MYAALNVAKEVLAVSYEEGIEAFPFFLIGIIVAGLVMEFFPRGILKRVFGTNRPLCCIMASCCGAALPVDAWSTVPISHGLFVAGASWIPVVIFWVAGPMTGPTTLAMTWGLLGRSYFLAVLLGAIVVSIFVGLAFVALIRKGVLTEPLRTGTTMLDGGTPMNEKTCNCDASSPEQESLVGRMKRAEKNIGYYFVYVGKWLVVGAIIAGAIEVLVPETLVTSWMGSGAMLSILLAALIALPMCGCEGANIMVARQLLLKGALPGAALAYALVAPATCVTALALGGGSFGAKNTAFWAAFLVIGGTILGLTFNLIIKAGIL